MGSKNRTDKKPTTPPAPAAKKVAPQATKPIEPPVVKHIVTNEDLVNNPDLETKGIKVGDEIDFVPLTKEQVEAAKAEIEKKGKGNAKPLEDNASKELIEKMKPYVDAYPDNKVFYISSDGQVFLENNKTDAELHEKTLGSLKLSEFSK